MAKMSKKMSNTKMISRLGTAAVAAILMVGLSGGAAMAQHHGHDHGKHDMKKGKKDTVEVWVCQSDESVGLSWKADCPLKGDDEPMVKKTIEASKLKDLKNDKCPIMGGDVDGSVFAVYKNQKVGFCCSGCQDKFFKDPKGHIAKLKGGGDGHEHEGGHGHKHKGGDDHGGHGHGH